MTIVAIDPGSEQSAIVRYDADTKRIVEAVKLLNREVLVWMDWMNANGPMPPLAVEMVASYGMAVGREVFETCVWIGRFIERWAGAYTLVYRKDVKLHHCGSMRATDANIRQALIDRFGPTKALAIGTKKQPGPLHELKGDLWSALAIAVTYAERGQQHVASTLQAQGG